MRKSKRKPGWQLSSIKVCVSDLATVFVLEKIFNRQFERDYRIQKPLKLKRDEILNPHQLARIARREKQNFSKEQNN